MRIVSRVKRTIRWGHFLAGSELAGEPAIKHVAIERATARSPLTRLHTRPALTHERFDIGGMYDLATSYDGLCERAA